MFPENEYKDDYVTSVNKLQILKLKLFKNLFLDGKWVFNGVTLIE